MAAGDLEQRGERGLVPEVVERRDDVEAAALGDLRERRVLAGPLVRLQAEPELAPVGGHVSSDVGSRRAPDPLDAHDHALVGIGAGEERVLLEPVAVRQGALLRGEQGEHGLEREDAEVPARRDPQPARLRQLEPVADLEPADRASLDPLDGHPEVVELRDAVAQPPSVSPAAWFRRTASIVCSSASVGVNSSASQSVWNEIRWPGAM